MIVAAGASTAGQASVGLRYPELAPHVQDICRRYGQGYCTGSFREQLGSVVKRIGRLSLPGPRLLRAA